MARNVRLYATEAQMWPIATGTNSAVAFNLKQDVNVNIKPCTCPLRGGRGLKDTRGGSGFRRSRISLQIRGAVTLLPHLWRWSDKRRCGKNQRLKKTRRLEDDRSGRSNNWLFIWTPSGRHNRGRLYGKQSGTKREVKQFIG